MKNAYSTLLGEYVEAGEVDYEDTHGFQIVCPCCREAVFKVSRRHTARPIDFFSHHHADPMQRNECELRVGRLSPEYRAAENAKSRGQSLQVFLSVLRQAISLDKCVYPKGNVEGGQWRMRNHEGVRHFLLMYRELIKQDRILQGFDDRADAYISRLQRHGQHLNTGFAFSIQKRIAGDVLKHLKTEQASTSMDFLVRHVLHLSMTGLAQAKANGAMPMLVDLYDCCLGAIMQPKLERMKMGMRYVVQTKPAWSENKQTYIERFIERFDDDLCGVLLRLPYKDILANHQAGRPILEGVAVPPEGRMLGVALEPEPVTPSI